MCFKLEMYNIVYSKIVLLVYILFRGCCFCFYLFGKKKKKLFWLDKKSFYFNYNKK